MKNRSSATDAILATGEYLLYELWDLILPTGQTYHFTDGEIPLNNVTVYVPGGTIGPFNYQTGMIIVRDAITQKSGTEAGQLKVTFVPQGDSISLSSSYTADSILTVDTSLITADAGSITSTSMIAGYTPQIAARYGFLNGATVRMSKCFLNPPAAGHAIDTSPGAMGYFLGTVQGVEINRFFIDLIVEDAMSLLGDQQMPKNLYEVGCFHQVYDAGCGLLAATFTVTGTVATVGDAAHFTSNLTQADDYFDLGVVTFNGNVTALLAGQTMNVVSFKHTSGALALLTPASVLPETGDTFTIYPGCDRQQLGGCTKLSNLARFGGVPYMPVPETIIDGGTDNPPPQAAGSQAGQLIGSTVSGQQTAGKYST